MIRHAMMAGTLILLSAAVCLAANVNGRWEGSISGPNGDMQLVFNFHATGSKLTGTVQTPMGGEEPLSDGKVNGDHLSFKTHFQDTEINHEGTVNGNTIDLKIRGARATSRLSAPQAKSSATDFF
ncbi:MAG: hypothetical protein P8Z30_02355 [Acidobacteriota bacterium]